MRDIVKIGRVIAVSVLVAVLLFDGPRTGAGMSIVIDVSPSSSLTDFQRVEITGSGFEPGIYEWFECRGGAVDESDCDGYNSDFIYAGPDGTMSEIVYVDARIWLPDGTEVDCRTDPAGCEIGVGYLVDADEWPEIPLGFDPAAPLRDPVTATAEPSTDLVDDQVVTLHGSNLSFHEEAWAYLCRPGDGMVGTRCDIDRRVSAVPALDGTADLELTVRAVFDPPLGGHVDCRSPGTSCVAVVAWGFSPPPDRVTTVPLTFADTTPPPTTTTPSTPPTPLPPSPPAEPISDTAQFTG
jgi:hypothetical protein